MTIRNCLTARFSWNESRSFDFVPVVHFRGMIVRFTRDNAALWTDVWR
ncbi:MAG TPA: hypothetical protein VJ813_03055 [Vicinamibacterales bacterium]|nr:hypothetical protein [Vicinamibacterales bacterium]